MSHFGSGVEQALHCLLFLVDREGKGVPSARDLAEFQGVSTIKEYWRHSDWNRRTT